VFLISHKNENIIRIAIFARISDVSSVISKYAKTVYNKNLNFFFTSDIKAV